MKPTQSDFFGRTADGAPNASSQNSLAQEPRWSVKGPPYATIVADPPWPESGGGRIRRGADRHYELMTIEDIEALAPFVREMAEPAGCHLYLWVTNNYVPAGLKVMEAWGFRYVTLITWGKVKDDGTPTMGLGQYFRGATEHALFGVRGSLPYRMTEDDEPKRAQGRTLILAPRTEHSVKPAAFQDMVELVSHPPYLEMFARSKRLGWDSWGREAP